MNLVHLHLMRNEFIPLSVQNTRAGMNLPKRAKPGEICQVDGALFVYNGEEWERLSNYARRGY